MNSLLVNEFPNTLFGVQEQPVSYSSIKYASMEYLTRVGLTANITSTSF